jgi:hypothetical protein
MVSPGLLVLSCRSFPRRCFPPHNAMRNHGLSEPSHPEAPVSPRIANPPKSLKKVAEAESGSNQIEHSGK